VARACSAWAPSDEELTRDVAAITLLWMREIYGDGDENMKRRSPAGRQKRVRGLEGKVCSARCALKLASIVELRDCIRVMYVS
jgi:hypothetical protein